MCLPSLVKVFILCDILLLILSSPPLCLLPLPPPPTQCDPRRSHGAARRSWVCSSHADTSGAGTAGERRHPPKVTSSCSSHLVPVDLAFHLFFTNFFLEALGFNRLLPAPKVLSRICRVADRLEMSFSAKGDTPAT